MSFSSERARRAHRRRGLVALIVSDCTPTTSVLPTAYPVRVRL